MSDLLEEIEKRLQALESKFKKLDWLFDLQLWIELATKTKIRVSVMLAIVFLLTLLILGYFGIQATETVKYLIDFFK